MRPATWRAIFNIHQALFDHRQHGGLASPAEQVLQLIPVKDVSVQGPKVYQFLFMYQVHISAD